MPKGKGASLVLACFLVGIGVIILLGGIFPLLSIGNLWPLFLLIPVVSMVSGVRSARELAGVVFWVVYLLYLVVFFIFLNLHGWGLMSVLWPHFILAAGVGFLAEFVLTLNVNKLWLTVVAVMVSAYFFVPGLPFRLFVGVGLIFWGVWLLLTMAWGRRQKKEHTHN